MTSGVQGDFQPYRHIDDAESSDGRRGLIISAGAPPPIELRKLMAAGTMISQEHIRLLRAPMKLGDIADLDEQLEFALNLMRVTKHASEAAPLVYRDAHEQTAQAILTIIGNLPIVIERLQLALAYPQTRSSAAQLIRRTELVNKCRTLQAAAVSAQSSISVEPKSRRPAWHSDVFWLIYIINLAAFEKGKILSYTKASSPAVEFLRQAMALTGQHVGADAIGKAYSRYKAGPIADVSVEIQG